MIIWVLILAVCAYIMLRPRRAAAVKRRQHPPSLPEIHQSLEQVRDWTTYFELADAYRKGEYRTRLPDERAAVAMYKHAASSEDPVARCVARTRLLETTTEIPREDVAGIRPTLTYATRAMEIAKKPATKIITNDSQNAHDHGVVASLRHRLDTLPSVVASGMYEDIVDFVLSGDHPEKASAFRVLDTASGDVHSALGVSEREVLERVWLAIPEGSRDVLVSQLASGIERDSVVCSTGKIARILGSLDGLDDSPVIRPVWAVREELASLAAKIRDEHPASAAASAFGDLARAQYVDELGMDSGIVSGIIDEFKLGFE